MSCIIALLPGVQVYIPPTCTVDAAFCLPLMHTCTTCFHRLARVIALRMLLSVRLPPGGAGETLI
jgi:hypothetical protein